jgi:hypothetical protein
MGTGSYSGLYEVPQFQGIVRVDISPIFILGLGFKM